jgi:hypothetical protein
MYTYRMHRNQAAPSPPPRRAEPVYTVPLNDTRPTPNPMRQRPTFNDSVFYRTLRAFIPNYQDVVVRPTQEQIENATEQIVFRSSEDQTHTRCPITLEDFQDGDTVTRIRHCGHTFQNTGLSNWFTTNVRCPVCRYDIREWTPDVGEHADETSAEPSAEPSAATSRINSLINEITSGLNNAIQTHISTEYNRSTYRQSELLPDTTVYTFNIPLIYENIIDASDIIHRS